MEPLTTSQAAALLRDVADAHHAVEDSLPDHHWSDWYAEELARRGYAMFKVPVG